MHNVRTEMEVCSFNYLRIIFINQFYHVEMINTILGICKNIAFWK